MTTDQHAKNESIFTTSDYKANTMSTNTITNIQDFGAKIGGARKDTYLARFGDAPQGEISELKVSELFPKLDVKKLQTEGFTNEAICELFALRAMVPAKPRSSWKISRWVHKVTGILEAFREVIVKGSEFGEDDFVTSHGLFLCALGSDFLEKAIASKAKIEDGHWLRYNDHKNVTLAVPYVNGRALRGKESFASEKAERRAACIEAIREALGSEKATSAKPRKCPWGLYSNRYVSDNKYFGRKVRSKLIKVGPTFTEWKGAREWFIDGGEEKLDAEWAKMKTPPVLRRATNDPRNGQDWRNGRDISPQEFLETFNLKGVEFGNYVEQSRRQSDLNRAYDALLDLALVMRMEPKEIGLNATLGLAFGARGKGGKNAACAHYEPDFKAINLTKKSGPGSLAHEWFHSFDNWSAKGEGYGTMKRAETPLRTIGKAVKMVGNYEVRSSVYDKTRTKRYYGTTIELAARAFETWVVSEMEGHGFKNDYLANVAIGDIYPTVEENAELSPLFREIKGK